MPEPDIDEDSSSPDQCPSPRTEHEELSGGVDIDDLVEYDAGEGDDADALDEDNSTFDEAQGAGMALDDSISGTCGTATGTPSSHDRTHVQVRGFSPPRVSPETSPASTPASSPSTSPVKKKGKKGHTKSKAAASGEVNEGPKTRVQRSFPLPAVKAPGSMKYIAFDLELTGPKKQYD